MHQLASSLSSLAALPAIRAGMTYSPSTDLAKLPILCGSGFALSLSAMQGVLGIQRGEQQMRVHGWRRAGWRGESLLFSLLRVLASFSRSNSALPTVSRNGYVAGRLYLIFSTNACSLRLISCVSFAY
jgi:hypothetical protein